jgi:hypothetical protein
LNEGRRLTRVAKHAAELGNTARQRLVGDGGARTPDAREQLLALDHLAGPLRERRENFHDLRLEVCGAVGAGHFAGQRPHFPTAELEPLLQLHERPPLNPRP